MDIQDLVRERIIGNIKIGTRGENGLPKKLSYFHIEKDKATTDEMVKIFKKLYPEKPTTLRIRFTTERPFDFKYKRYMKGNAVCVGNNLEAVTIGKDNKGNSTKVKIECNKECSHRQDGKCKLKGSLKFILEGIDAGGLWNLNTCGGTSLSNIASEIVKYKKAGMSIVNVPFELTLTEQQSIGYGTYYSIDLHRTDIKPQLIEGRQEGEIEDKQENKKLPEVLEIAKEDKKPKKEKKKEVEIIDKPKEEIQEKEDFSNYLIVKKIMPTLINNVKFSKIIFQDINSQDVEYVLHPKANQELLECMPGTVIEVISSKLESERNILCKYNMKKRINYDGSVEELQMKEAV